VCCIADTGVGLRPEQLAQLFQGFNRLGQEAGGEEGTGIGLVVAKRLVELMRGRWAWRARSAWGVCSGSSPSAAEPHNLCRARRPVCIVDPAFEVP